MTDSGYTTGDAPLTAVERARLRESVRIDALEQWFAATGGECRRTVIAHFAREVTPEDIRASHIEVGSTEEELAEMERMLAEPLPTEGPVHTPGPDAPPGAVAFTVIPHTDFIISVYPPDDPHVRALWDAIEPIQRA